jgi:uncharacterized membrane protein
MPQQLVVIAVDSPARAQELLLAAGQLASEGKLEIDDAVVLTKSADGKSHKLETTDLTPVEGGVGGAFWGLFLGTLVLGPVGGLVTGAVTGGAGALLAKVIDRGISDEFTKEMESLLEPGRAAVCLLTDHEDAEAVLAELSRFDGTLVWSDLPDEAAAEITRALASGEHDHAIPVEERPAPPVTPPA